MKREVLSVAVIVLFFGLALAPGINAFKDSVPDLDCYGDLYWIEVEPGSTVTGTFTIENIGDPDSKLNWEIISWPEWGNWTFDPNSGTGIEAGETQTIDVECVLPDDLEGVDGGEIKVVNIEKPDDYCIIIVTIHKGKINDDFVELDVEFCGLGKKRTVKLTQGEYAEVELLFDDIQDRLSRVESDDEAVVIFNEAIIKLDSYDLLGGLSVKQAQDLVTGKFLNLKIYKLLLSSFENNKENSDIDNNKMCFIAGESTSDTSFTWFHGLPWRIASTFAWNLYLIGFILNNINDDWGMNIKLFAAAIMEFLGLYFIMKWIVVLQKPFMFGGWINYGIQGILFNETLPAEGWVSTYGLNGNKNWSGEMYGNLMGLLNWPFLWGLGATLSYPGVSGFFGLIFKYKFIEENNWIYPTKYIGFALRVKLGPEPPFIIEE